MTDQPESTISPEIIQAAFAQSYGPSIGQLTFQKLNLEMQNRALQARLADIETRAFDVEQDNARMIKAKINFEDEAFNLQAEVTALADRTQELEAELAECRANEKAARIEGG